MIVFAVPSDQLLKTGLVSCLLAMFISSVIGCSRFSAGGTIVYDHCIIPPSPIGAKGENAVKGSLAAVELSGSVEATFKSEATKLLEINQELVKLYALGTYCLMSKGLTDAQKSALHDQINSIASDVTSGKRR